MSASPPTIAGGDTIGARRMILLSLSEADAMLAVRLIRGSDQLDELGIDEHARVMALLAHVEAATNGRGGYLPRAALDD